MRNHRVTEDAQGTEGSTQLTSAVIGAAIQVHRTLGPGLLERCYEACLDQELRSRGLTVARQVRLPVRYRGITLDEAYQLDMVVEGKVLIEVKSVAAVSDVHRAQTLTYLQLSGLRIGLLLNFNAPTLAKGIERFVVG